MLNYQAIAGTMSGPELASVYNKFAKDKIKRFATVSAGLPRVVKLLENKSPDIDKIKKLVSNDTAEKISKIPVKKEFKTPGPKSKFLGKKIYLKVKENPRREGTHGHKSFEILKDLGFNRGMPYEEYKQLKGRNNDLQWDIDHGYVEVK